MITFPDKLPLLLFLLVGCATPFAVADLTDDCDNQAMQRNGGSSRLDMDTFLPPSADGGR